MTAAYFGVGGYGSGSASIIHGDSSQSDHIVIPDAQLLFTAHFHRAGPDLVLTGRDGHNHIIPGYFSVEHRAALVTPNGAVLSADLVGLLAGSAAPNEYAQAGQVTPPEPIGRVEKIVGEVTVIRNGVSVALNVGDAVYKSDVVQTAANSSCGVAFPDGTALNVIANTRIALNDYVYDPNSTSNSALFNLVEGGLSFVAGKVAHTGDMKIGTPVAILGIRGTAGWLYEDPVSNITANAGNVTLHFAAVFDTVTNTQSTYSLYAIDANGELQHDPTGNLISLAQVSSMQNGLVTSVSLNQNGINALAQAVVNVAPPDFNQQQFQNIVVPQVIEMAKAAIQQFGNQQQQQQQNQTNPQSNGTTGSSTPPPASDGTEVNPPLQQINLNSGSQPVTITATVIQNQPTTNPPPAAQTPQVVTPSPAGPPIDAWSPPAGSGPQPFTSPPDWNPGPPAPTDSIVDNSSVPMVIADAQTIAGLTVGAGAQVQVVGSSAPGSLTVTGTTDDSGTIKSDSTSSDPVVTFDQAVTVESGGVIEATGSSNTAAIIFASGVTMNAGAQVLASGNGASVTFDGGVTIASGAEVLASGSGASVYISNTNGPVVTNSGLVLAGDGGAVTFFDVQVENASGTIEATGAGSVVSVSTADIVGGTLETGNPASAVDGVIEVGAGLEPTFFDGSTSGAVTVDAFVQVDSGDSLELLGTIDDEGTIALGTDAEMIVSGQVALDGSGTILLGGGILTNAGGPSDELINSGNTIAGTGTIEDLTIINQNGGALHVDSGQTLTLIDSIVDGGTLSSANNGQFVVENGPNNAGSTLENTVANDANFQVSGTLALSGDTISGGTIDLALGSASPQPVEIAVLGYYAIGPEVSANGQFVAFIASTSLPDEGSGETNGSIELYNVSTGQITNLSNLVPEADLQQGETFGNLPSISDNGHLVVFDGKYQTDSGDQSEVFLYNSQAAPGSQVTLVSANAGQAVISGNGEIIAAEGNTSSDNGSTHILVMNAAGVVQTEITGDPNYTPPNDNSDNSGNIGSVYNPSLSDDGRFVTFWSTSSEIAVVGGPSFATGDTTGAAEVYVYDTLTHTLQEASGVLGGAQGNGNSGTLDTNDNNGDSSSWASSISGNGRFVVFQSTANNLVNGVGDAGNDVANIFLYDSHTGQITAVTDANGATVTGTNIRPSISADGKYLTFSSDDSDLPGYNGGWQTYMVAIDPATGALGAPELLSAGFPGADNGQNNLASSVSDGGGVTAFGGAAFAINSQQGQATLGNGTIAFSGLSVTDFDGAGDTLTLTISVAHGTLVATGSGGAGQQGLTITGTLAQIDAALQTGVTYTPGSPPSANDTLSVQVADQTSGATASFASQFNPEATDPSQIFSGQPAATGQYDIFLSEQQTIDVTGNTTIDGGAQIEGGLITVASGVILTLNDITDTDTSIHVFTGTVAFTGSSTLEGTGIFGGTNQSSNPTGQVTVGSGVTLILDDVVLKNVAVTVDSDGATPSFQIDAGYTLTWAGNSTFGGPGSIIIDNNGHIIHDGTLDVGFTQTTLEGSGTVTYDNGNTSSETHTLINEGNTLDGYGTFGSGLTFDNDAGSVDADVAGQALVLDTGKTIVNDGTFIADGGILKVLDAVTGSGSAIIEHNGTLELGNSDSLTVTFNDASTLQLDQQQQGNAEAYTGTIDSVASGDVLDLTGFGTGAHDQFQVSTNYDPDTDTTTLTVTDTTLEGSPSSAPITLSGNYTASVGIGWAAASDGHGGIDLSEGAPPVTSFDPTYLTFSADEQSATGPVPSTQTTNVTIAGWINWGGGNAIGSQEVLFYTGTTSSQGYGLIVAPTADGLDVQGLVGGNNVLDGNTALSANQWYFVALTQVDGTFQLYVDGVEQTDLSNAGTAVNAFGAGAQMQIGGPGAFNDPEIFSGSIADVSVWDTALTQSQIEALQGTYLSGNEPGLAGYYPLSDGSGTTAADSVNSAGNLTLSGNPTWVVDGNNSWPITSGNVVENSPATLLGLNVSNVNPDDTITVTLDVNDGVLTLGSTAGLSGESGVGTDAVTLTGTESEINAALTSGVTYTPTTGFTGGDTLTFTASDGGVSSNPESLTINVVPAAVSQATSSLTASPSTVAADGTSTTTLTVTAEDANGHVIADATVTLTATGTGNTFTSPITGTTNAEGVFTTTLSSATVQDDTFTALINGTASETATVDFAQALSVTASVIDNLAVQEGQTLVATATIADTTYSGATISYQWQSSSDGGITWTNVGGALAGNFNNGQPSSFLQVTEADEGLEYRVEASFTNSNNQVITATSAPTAAVADVTPLITPAFNYKVDDLSIVKNDTEIYTNTFAQAPPASSTISNSGVATPIVFVTLGSTWTEGTNNAGQAAAVLSSTGVAQSPVSATTDQVFASLTTNTDPTNTTQGLKEGTAFTVSATFDLTAAPYGSYGLQLNNGTSTHTPDQVVSLFVQSGSNGSTVISLIDSDPAAGTSTVLASQTLTTAELASSNEVEFQLSHVANSTAVTGTFELLDNGTVTLGPTTFTPTGTMFANGENWTQADIGAFVSSGVGLNVGAGQSVQVGETLTASATTNDPDATINYQWEESSSSSFSSFTDIGSNSSSYTVQHTDLGDYIRVVATTSDPDNTQSATAMSAVTGAVLDGPPTVTVPVITGTAQEGQTLTASATAGGDDTLSYQWMENSGVGGAYRAIVGATASTYVVQEGDEGYQIEVVATAANANGVTASQTSTPTSAVIDDATLAVAVSTTDSSLGVQEGQTLVAVATIAGDATDLAAPVTYQWQSSSDGGQTWTDVGGAISGNYTSGIASFLQLTEANEGQEIRVQASFTDDTGQTVSATSTPTTTVGDVTPVITAPFSYAVDDLSLVRNGTEFYNDTFSEAPPASPLPLTLSTPIVYFTNGSTWSESNGQAILSSTGLAPTNTGTGNYEVYAILNTNTDPTNTTMGLKEVQSFTVSATFDLTAATPGTSYGVQLNDGTSTQVPDQIVSLYVHGQTDGSTVVELVQSDLATDPATSTVLSSETLTAAQLEDASQIELQLSHVANSTALSGTFELLNEGTGTPVTFTPTGTIFTDGVDWTRADLVALTSSGVGLNVGAGQSVQVGQTLTASATTNDSDATLNYQWEESSSSSFGSFTDIGSNSSNYTVQASDLGDYIRVVATASDPDNPQSATATSAVTGTVLDASPTVTVPAITGIAQEGQTLTAAATAGGDDTLSYQWMENSGSNGTYQAIVGATGSTYVVQEGDEGYQIDVIATATNANGVTASETSAPTAAVIDDASLSVSTSVLGNPGSLVQEGQALITFATITGDASDLSAPVTYQWQTSSNGGTTWTEVAATTSFNYNSELSSVYQLSEADEGNIFRAQASFTDDTGQVITATSTPTVPVADITPILSVPFSYTVDEFKYTNGLGASFDDTFTDGPPPVGGIGMAGSLPIGFQTSGGGYGSTWTEGLNNLGQPAAIMSSSGAAFNGIDNSVEALLLTSPQPEGTGAGESNAGLKENDTFTISATFDLVAPQIRTSYGIAVVNAASGPTTEEVQLQVDSDGSGGAIVILDQNNPSGGVYTQLASFDLTAQQLTGNTQIELDLAHNTIGSSTVVGSFELYDDGTQTFADTFTPSTPGHVFDNSTAARGEIQAIDDPGNNITILGTPVEGQTLTANTSTNDADATINYQWQESADGGDTWNSIEGATGSTYALQQSDENNEIRVVATTSDPDNTLSATATSVATGPVQDASPTVTVPVIEGTAQDGQTLTVSASAGGDDTLSYQWMENSGPNGTYQAIAGATGATYVVQQGDEGYQIDVVATATNADGVTASETSVPTAIVPPTTAADTFTEAAIGDPSNWFDPDNWSIEVPTANDQVVISATDAQAAFGAAVAGSLDVNSSAALDVFDASLSVSDTLQNTATITVEGDADGVVASLYFGGDVTNNGSIALSGDAIPNATSANGESVTFASSVTNTGSISLEAEVHGDRGAAPNVASALFVGPVTNTGTITVGAGTTTQVASATFESTVNNTGGQIIVNTGAAVMLDSATVEGGTITSTDSINVSGPVLLEDGIQISGGALNLGNISDHASTLDIETDPNQGLGNPADAVFDAVNVNDYATLDVGTTTVSGGLLMLEDGAEIFGKPPGAASPGTLNIGSAGEVKVENNGNNGIAATFDDLNVTLQSAGTAKGLIQVDGTLSPTNLTLTDGTVINGGELSIGPSGEVEIAFSDNISPDAVFEGGVTVANQGTLQIDSDTSLALAGTVTLQGGGTVSMELNSGIGEVFDTAATLDNVDNTIEGAGFIGNADNLLTLINNGTIDANFGGQTLTIDIADNSGNSGTLTNAGTLKAENNGELSVHGVVNDTGGQVIASGGFVDFELGVTGGGTGTASISNGGKIEYGWSSDVATTFAGDGTLVLDHQNQADANYLAAHFSGAVLNFGLGDTIDLTDLTYSANETVSWDQLTTGANADGTLTVDSNGETASITLDGTYSQGDFALATDGSSVIGGPGTDIVGVQSPYLWGSITSPAQATTGVHLYGSFSTVPFGSSNGALVGVLYGVTSSGYSDAGPDNVTTNLLTLDPFLLPYQSSITANGGTGEQVATTTITDFPHNSRQMLLVSLSNTQTEGIGFSLSEDGSGNATINKFTFDENTTGLNGSSAPTITNDGAVESNLIGTDLQYFASFENGSSGTFIGAGSAYGLGWAQYNGTAATLDGVAPDIYQINFQIFPNTASNSPVETIATFSNVTSLTDEPAWFFHSAGSVTIGGQSKAIFASAVAESNGTANADIQFQAYSESGTTSISGTALPSFVVAPNLTYYTDLYGSGVTDAITQQPASSTHTYSANSLMFALDTGGSSYSFAWDDTVTAGGSTYHQVEFALYTQSGSLVSPISTFQVADAQNIELQQATIDGANVEILAYGDNTGTHVVEFDASGHEIASLFDPSTTTFDQLGGFGDGRISLTYDNLLDSSGTTQYTTDIYDLRTSGLNVNDAGVALTSDQYFSGTQYGDDITVGASNVDSIYYYVGDNTTGPAPTDHFTGTTGTGWNVAILPDALSDYSISTNDGVTTLIDTGDPAHAGSLAVTDVQFLAFDPASDPTPYNNAIDVNGGTFVILEGNIPGTSSPAPIMIEAGATAEIDTGASYTGSVTFNAGTGILVLDQASDFGGTISGFTGTAPDAAHSDVVEVAAYNETSFSEQTTNGNLVLTLNGGGGSTTITFDNFDGALNFSSDAQGDFFITDPSAPPAPANATVDSVATASGASGGITFADENSADALSPSFSPEGSDYLGNFSVSQVSASTGNATVSWEFDFSNEQVSLTQGQTLTQSYNVTLADEQNSAANQSQTVSVTVGGPGNDNFVFAPGVGADTVLNFNPQQDTIELDHFAAAQTVQELQSLITNDTHGDAVIDLGNHDSITLANTTTTQLQQAIQAGHILLH